jgi:uncharacterized membrane protein (UPF0182 family)
MYLALLAVLLGGAALLAYLGVKKNSRPLTALGFALIPLVIAFFWFLGFWGEKLWFDALGYEERFWILIGASAGFAAAGLAVGGLAVYLLLIPLKGGRPLSRWWAVGLGALVGALWGVSNRSVILLFLNRTAAGVSEPILGHDAGFYLFTLPFLDALYALAVLLALLGLGASFLYSSLNVTSGQWEIEPSLLREERPAKAGNAFYLSAGVLLIALAFGKYLDRYHLLFSEWGVVTGPGWTDVNVRLPMLFAAAAVTFLMGLALLLPPLRARLRSLASRVKTLPWSSDAGVLAGVGAAVVLSWFLLLSAAPKAFQWLKVEPNEITLESRYIEHNIRFTRQGFNLHEVEEREFPATGTFTREMVERNRSTFKNIRLWDWRALDAVYKQFQEIRLYYEFVDVDIDRYTIGEEYREVMVSAREMNLNNLPADSQTFVNRRFKYTHGYGLTLSSVSEFTANGLPHLLIKDIPPVSEHPDLEVERPQIYYGELTDSHVIVNTEVAEFDYPSGEKNVSIRYPGEGGVPMSGLWRKFLFGWKFDGTSLLLSGYPKQGSRIMFHRDILDRVENIAPFLHFDNDPYVVLADGRIYWIIDAYVTSSNYPYSETFHAGEMSPYRDQYGRVFAQSTLAYLEGSNYLRNSVKAVVDAFDGSVDFYVFEEDDPLIRAWSKVFPELFKPREDMPENLLSHIRYPSDMLLTQGLVYAKYHMTDPTVFYNQEDLWIRATEKYYNQVQPVEPYYVMWQPPDSDRSEFVLILPFTPKNRQVLIGWIAGMCDPENYGRFLAYKFPKEKRVLGPQQVETKIDQDRFLSGQLTLWDQRGSNVIRGNVLAIPVEKTLIYVEPIYLQAETAAYPELRLVAVMHEDKLSYAESFEEALQGLFGEAEKPEFAEGAPAMPETIQELAGRAQEAFDAYLQSLGQGNFQAASDALDRLSKTLERLTRTTGRERQGERPRQ